MSELNMEISAKMRLALEVFEHASRDVSWFGEQFMGSGRIADDIVRFLPGNPAHKQAQQVVDSMVAAGLIQLHWKRRDEYELTTKGKKILAIAHAADR